MAYNYNPNEELDENALDKPFAWPNAQIGEEMARENGFVNEFHGGPSVPANGELSTEELDNVVFNPDFYQQAYEDVSQRKGRR